MAEYIEREKTVKLLRSLGNREYRKEKGTIQDAIKMISYPEYTPAADVAPVVRCKDCEWFADNNDGSWFGCWLFQTIRIIPEDAPKPDDFCSYGELKMDGGGDR